MSLKWKQQSNLGNRTWKFSKRLMIIHNLKWKYILNSSCIVQETLESKDCNLGSLTQTITVSLIKQ